MDNRKRKYKLFDYCWHIPHQYDMINSLKEDCDFSYCLVTKKHWNTNQRPLPDLLQFVTVYEPGAYDIAILHIDQQTSELNSEKRRIYLEFNELILDIPKIVINHGSPVFPEYYGSLDRTLTHRSMEIACINEIRSLVGQNIMVVNSHMAASSAEWGFGIPIVHGITPSDWKDLPKEPRVFTALSPVGFDTYYNRECMLRTADLLSDKYGYRLNYAGVNMHVNSSMETYRDYMGRSLIYLDTSFRTPMNRARTEAFLSGCCVIQVEGAHDLDRWAIDGENIILVPDEPAQIAATVADILTNRYEEALHIGEKGKMMARREFDPQRYRREWLEVFKKVNHGY